MSCVISEFFAHNKEAIQITAVAIVCSGVYFVACAAFAKYKHAQAVEDYKSWKESSTWNEPEDKIKKPFSRRTYTIACTILMPLIVIWHISRLTVNLPFAIAEKCSDFFFTQNS